MLKLMAFHPLQTCWDTTCPHRAACHCGSYFALPSMFSMHISLFLPLIPCDWLLRCHFTQMPLWCAQTPFAGHSIRVSTSHRFRSSVYMHAASIILKSLLLPSLLQGYILHRGKLERREKYPRATRV